MISLHVSWELLAIPRTAHSVWLKGSLLCTWKCVCLEGYCSILLLSYSISSGALGSSVLLLSYLAITLHCTTHSIILIITPTSFNNNYNNNRYFTRASFMWCSCIALVREWSLKSSESLDGYISVLLVCYSISSGALQSTYLLLSCPTTIMASYISIVLITNIYPFLNTNITF